jgi:hypothetical protein
MQIRLGTLRRIIRETAEYSSLNIKPGMTLRYTGGDMEKPNFVKVLKVVGNPDTGEQTIVAGDQKGQVHKILGKELHAGEYEVAQGGAPEKKKPAPWAATR